MKQIILLCTLFLFFLQAGVAQVSLTLSPNPVETVGDAIPNDDFHEIIGYATLRNESDQTISIKWERVEVELPGGWETLVCDKISCYEPIVYSNIAPEIGMDAPVILAPGDTTNLDVHVVPKGVAGNAEIRIDVSLVDDPDNVLLSGSYTFNAALVSSTEIIDKARLAVFPNPATDYVQVQGAPNDSRLVVHNILGRQLRSFNLAPGSRHYVGDLPTGLYLASVMNRNGDIVRTFRLSKRSLRP